MCIRNFLVVLGVLMVFALSCTLAKRTKDSTPSKKWACYQNDNPLPVWYDNTTHECTTSGVVKRPIAPTTTENTDRTHHVSASSTTPATVIQTSTDVDLVDIFKCGSVSHTGKSTGYECCGYGIYRPDFDTCCMQMGYKFKIHNGKRHKDHICCGLDAHSRSLVIPCLHLARNDRLWKTKLTFMRKYRANKYCSNDKHEYFMTVGAKDELSNFQFYHANITKLDDYGHNTSSEHVRVAIDKFSPNCTLEEKSFFIISGNIYKNNFYLGFNDVVMKVPRKMPTFWKRFKTIQKKCKQLGNR